MDNPLTPKKIQRLINLAEGRSLNFETLLLTEDEVKILAAQANLDKQNRSTGYHARYESSSGIIDLDQVQGFGESGTNSNISLSKSSTFNPGELTGRSTGASENPIMSGLSMPHTDHYGRHSIAIDSISGKMDKQTSEINDLMRHSIASNYSFHSKRDLTADEVSLIAREAPLPLQQTYTYFGDAVSANSSNLSVGAYFRNRCLDFAKILAKTDSPDKSNMMPSISEVSSTRPTAQEKQTNLIQFDDMLDSVPVRQPRNNDTTFNKLATTHTAQHERSNIPVFKQPSKPAPQMSQDKHLDKTSSANTVQESKLPQHIRALNPVPVAHKSFKTPCKPADLLLKNLQSSFMPVSDDTEETIENSISLSKIADYLGKQSNVSVTDILQKHKKPGVKKIPLSELHMNTQNIDDLPVTKLSDSKKTEIASSAGTIQTVIDFGKLNLRDNIPKLVVTEATAVLDEEGHKRATRSRSPSSQTASTQSTVRDNYSNIGSSFKAEDSPYDNDEANRSKVPSPNIAYKELDKSVDWQEVLQQKKMREKGVVKEQWVSLMANPVNGFVGVTTSVTISVTTVTDSWLTAKFQFNSLPNDGKDMNVELPRLPLLLSPGKTEDFNFHITSNVEMNTVLPYTFYVKDTSIDGEMKQKGELKVNFIIPGLQAMTSDGINKVLFPTIPGNSAFTKTFVLVSDCPADLQLKLSITEGDSLFCIKSVQEIKQTDVNKVLMERSGSEDQSKPKGKLMNKQLCRLVKDSAISVSITFNSPKVDMQLFGQSGIKTSYNGLLEVTLIGTNTVLGSVHLMGLVGIPKLNLDEAVNKIHVAKEPTEINLSNRGTVAGTWTIKCRSASERKLPFQFNCVQFTIAADASTILQVCYTGSPNDGFIEIPIYLEELTTGETTELILTAGGEKPKIFPVKSSTSSLSWVKEGRKEISLKNNMDKKVHIRCHIAGDGFSIDLPGGDSRVIVLSFNPLECRPLPIVFVPSSCMPHAATLHMSLDRGHDGLSRKIPLYGCSMGAPVRWAGLVTYSDTAALVRAASRAPIHLRLQNKANMPAFIAARVQYNLQYMQVEPFCQLVGANRVVAGRASHTVTLRVDWPRVERRARQAATTAFATITVLTGAETTRRRILKILKDESEGRLDASLLPVHLRVLTQEFDGEEAAIDNFLAEYSESKCALSELIHSGLQELTAHVDLPHDFGDDTVVISEDTVVDHHTLCE